MLRFENSIIPGIENLASFILVQKLLVIFFFVFKITHTQGIDI